MIAGLAGLARAAGLTGVAHRLVLAAMEAAQMADRATAGPVDEIVVLLRQKRELDFRNQDSLGMASYDRWMVEALAALLRIASEEKARQRPT